MCVSRWPTVFVAALTLGLLSRGAAQAEGRWALGPEVGTAGIGLSLEYKASRHFVIRTAFDNFEYDGDVKGDVLTYKGKFRLNTGSLFLDWHPWANGWLVSGGAYMGARDAGGGPQLQAVNVIGGRTFTLDEARGINADVHIDQFAPTLALGWNNTFEHRRWGFKALAGVVFSEQPTVTLSRLNGPPLPPDIQALLDDAIKAEQQRIASHLDILKTYPLIELGVNYRF